MRKRVLPIHDTFTFDKHPRAPHNSGQKFDGGVKLFVDSIPNVYQDKPQTVANFVYNGLHGWASVNWHGSVSPMKPSPLNRIYKKT